MTDVWRPHTLNFAGIVAAIDPNFVHYLGEVIRFGYEDDTRIFGSRWVFLAAASARTDELRWVLERLAWSMRMPGGAS